MFRSFAASAGAGLCFIPRVFSQAPAKVEFARDVQPIFRQNCIGCHGPAKQNNGLRVDRRSSVLKLGTRRVVPGSSENSFLYHRVSGSDFGLQMPPTGPLHPEQVQTIKAWIEQGAEWPDFLANEIDLPPPNPKAVALVETLRAAERQAFHKMLAEDPKLLNAPGPEGSTPFMYAALYTDAPTLERLIRQGADPNKRNDAGATALMWAALDLEKTKVLLAHGADVNARSDDARTPLMVAASRPGGAPIVKLLLAHGAIPNPTSNPGAEWSPLLEASLAGDADSMQALLDHGAAFKDIAGFALVDAAAADCAKCIDLLVARNLDAMQYTIALPQVAVLDNPKLVKLLLDHGADVNAKSQHRQSGDTGRTALDLAKLHGDTAVVDLLLKSGATSAVPAASIQAAPMRSGASVKTALANGLPLLQRADASFAPTARCVSCHNDSLAAIAVGLARKSGFRVDEQTSAHQVKVNAEELAGSRDLLHQGTFIFGVNVSPAILAYILIGLDAEGYQPDLSTDAVAMFIQTHQMADGHWAFGPEARPPLCADTLGQTALAMRGLQLYTPRVHQAAYAKSIQLAATWIGDFRPTTNYDLAWRLQGLAWASQRQDLALKARRDLLAVQRSNGGWSDVASMQSGAYTTGLAMLALQSSGLPVSDPAYQRGVEYLLNTQLEDGSWHVRSRAAGFQPYFDNGFPHGVDQWISAAGTSLATAALTLAAPTADIHTGAGAAAGR